MADTEAASIDQIEKLYLNEGKELFPRELLENISAARKRGDRSIELPDYVDGTYTLDLDLGYNDHGTLKMIHYLPIQRLLNPWYHQTFHFSSRIVNPIQNVGKNTQLNCNMYELLVWRGSDEMWKASRRMWDESEMKKSIMEAFEEIPHQQLKAINRIVAFGFGSYDIVSQWNTDPHLGLPRNQQLILIAARHHAIQDFRTIIEKTGEDHKVEVFVQDEAFTEKDQGGLAELQFEPLEDPDGYLKIDKNTLVVIFEKEQENAAVPNYVVMQMLENAGLQVPGNAVMQVIADITETKNIAEPREPAMIFHTKIEKEDWEDYKATERGGNGALLPLKGRSMDSTSPRVQALIEKYEEVDFKLTNRMHQSGDPKVFSSATRLYVRKGLGQA